PLRADPDAPCGQGRHPRDRLAQHRRHQRAADGKQAARRADPGPRLPQGDGGDPACPAPVWRLHRRLCRHGRAPRPPLPGVAWLSRRQGRRDAAGHPHRPAAVAGRARLCRRLDFPARDAPNLVACRDDGRGQRTDCRLRPSFRLCPAAARFRVARPVATSREHPSPHERNRATSRIEDLADRLRLLRTPGIGPVTYRQLIARFGAPAAALAAVPDLARRGGGKAPALASRESAEREIARVEKLGARFLALGQGLYPRLLAELEDAPPLLIARGNLKLLDSQSVAIVGARNASAAACRFARGLAHDLGQDGLVVVSGLARGIDSAAHDGALETGTIGGIDVFYPPENQARQEALYERGLVLAEMPPGTEPRARHFPYRNRIIAGMSSGTV